IMRKLTEKYAAYTEPEKIMKLGLYPYFRSIDSDQHTVVTMHGKKVLMFGSNSYLGLTNHPKVKEAAIAAVQKYGTGCAGSRFLNGTLDIHLELEERLAKLTGKEAAICFSTGFQANLGVVSVMGGRHDHLLLDELDHASIIEGSRLSFAKSLKFSHNNMASLESKLRKCTHNSIKLIVVDGIFSMEGDIANLPGIVKLAEKHGAKNGAGTASHFGLTDKVDLIMGTFSKSLASLGGYIAADKEVISYIKHNSRPLIFSASMTPSSAAAVLAAMDIMESEPERIQHLWDVSNYARKALQNGGFDTGISCTPIIPLLVYDDLKALKMTRQMLDEGVFLNPVVSPAVPPGRSLIRFSLMATHTFEQVDEAVDKMTRCAKRLDIHA
ncbi:MAG: aminotransferase class I/II-fold pyridoxal phosphate-dependent enzyme, partial [Bacteroidia bacterium]|nr:aminotransferase class I/II-fold pyridoxal phosphate-dependent enzyme [Bacteroidia bacterium]